jgi:tRNA1(Val) A37 N6-methylase TrmN6
MSNRQPAEAAQPPHAPSHDAATRRARFPRGLAQPAGGFRFGADTLLLATFAAQALKAPKPGAALAGLDLGTGCGAASIGLLLLRPELPLRLTGIDTGPEMVAAAEENARALGLAEHFTPVLADAREHRAPVPCDFALANPPFRVPGTGRACPDENRDRARFEGPGGFAAFAACAGRNLRRGGTLFLVHLAERLPELLAGLAAAGLNTRRLLPVQGRTDAEARLVLLAAVRGGGTGLALLRPLVLYGPDNALTPEALAFCPPLAANPRRSAGNSAA